MLEQVYGYPENGEPPPNGDIPISLEKLVEAFNLSRQISVAMIAERIKVEGQEAMEEWDHTIFELDQYDDSLVSQASEQFSMMMGEY